MGDEDRGEKENCHSSDAVDPAARPSNSPLHRQGSFNTMYCYFSFVHVARHTSTTVQLHNDHIHHSILRRETSKLGRDKSDKFNNPLGCMTAIHREWTNQRSSNKGRHRELSIVEEQHSPVVRSKEV